MKQGLMTSGPWKWDAEGTRGFPVLYGGKDGGTAVLALPGDRSYLYLDSADAKFIEATPELVCALQEIVMQYEALPDGPLGKGFTNGPFLAAKALLERLGIPVRE